jgi:hypothetical protein
MPGEDLVAAGREEVTNGRPPPLQRLRGALVSTGGRMVYASATIDERLVDTEAGTRHPTASGQDAHA